MAQVIRYMFYVDPTSNKPVRGVKLEYDDAGPMPIYPSEYTHEGDANVWDNQHLATWDAVNAKFVIGTPDPAAVLKATINAKVASLKASEANDLKTFVSSALGTPHTYLSGPDDMTLLNGEYAFVKGNDFDGKDIVWFTVENGNVSHTAAQFVQVYLDGRKNVQTVKYRRATKEAQTGACTTTAQVDTVGWPENPNPPSVPSGLAGTAGAAGSGQVTLNWTANSDTTMIGGGGYNVYVDGAATPTNTALVTAATFTVTGLAVGVHTFAITAVDTDGYESAACAPITVNVS